MKKYYYYWIDCGKNGILPIYIGNDKKKKLFDDKLIPLGKEYKTHTFSRTLKYIILKRVKNNAKDLSVHSLTENDANKSLELIQKRLPVKYKDNDSKTVRLLIIKAYKKDIMTKPPLERFVF